MSKPYYPNGIGWERDLYSFPDLPAGTREWFEDHFLEHVDTFAAEALHTMEEQKTTQLSEKLRSAWTRFVFTLRYRHPDVLKELRVNIKAVWEKQLSKKVENYESRAEAAQYPTCEDFLTSITPETHAHMHSRLLRGLMDNERIGNRINNMYRQVLMFSGVGLEFLTSDWPVELHLGAMPRYLSIPISPWSLWVASEDVSVLRNLERTNPYKLIQRSNTLVVQAARRLVFSTDKRKERFVKNRMSKAMEPTPFYPPEVYDL